MKTALKIMCLSVISLATIYMVGCGSAPPPATPTATAVVTSLQRITSDTAAEFSPCISPDGNYIMFTAFDTQKSGTDAFSVAAVALEGSGRKLVAGPAARNACWTPDGDNIVYVFDSSNKPLLVRTPFDGAGMTYIAPTPLGDYDNHPDVNRDGTKIALQTRMGGKFHICTVDYNGSNFTIYTEGKSPSWHPTTETLAFAQSVGEYGQVFTIDLTTGQVTQLTFGEFDSSYPVWSPDGEYIAFSSNRDDKLWHVYMMKSDGSAVTQLTRGSSEEWAPDWGPEDWIYFTSNAGAPESMSTDPWKWVYADIWRVKLTGNR